MTAYGASPEAWQKFAELGLAEDLLPVVADTSVPIAGYSKMVALGKTPSRVDAEGYACGIGKWTQKRATQDDLARWGADPRLGICLQTRKVRAIDVDVNDETLSDEIAAALGHDLPMRERANKARKLFLFRYDGPMPKRVIPVDGGMIEFLGDGQQAVVAGSHPSGERYSWSGGEAPEHIPTLTEAELATLWDRLVLCFANGEPRIAREKREGNGALHREGLDEVAEWLLAEWTTYGTGSSGQLFIECPFAAGHSTESGPTSTAYFSAGSGGYEQGHVKCLHSSCLERSDAEFLDATGYNLAQFADLSGDPGGPGRDAADLAGQETGLTIDLGLSPLSLKRDKKGIEPSADNMVQMCSAPSWIGKVLAYDAFSNDLVWCLPHEAAGEEQWRKFSDNDTLDVRIELERRGTKPMGADLLRQSIHRAASFNEIDTAQQWLGRLVWDGVPRVDQFCVAAWGWTASEYATAVSRYIWTGLAGRVLEPGCQCDMAPVLVGAQGAGKTQSIKAMAPSLDHYITLPLDAHDTDTARLLRGKLIGELEELRGLNTRAIEAIKAWVTKTHESWIVKFKEFETKLPRRLLFFGTTNDEEFLNDPTGERRFLPGLCGAIDIEWVRANREQLWAEGMALFLVDGVAWQDAMALAPAEHKTFKVTDAWEQPVARWLSEKPVSLDGGGVAPAEAGVVQVEDALRDAVGIPSKEHDRARVLRMGKVLMSLGWVGERVYVDGKRVRAYVLRQ